MCIIVLVALNNDNFDDMHYNTTAIAIMSTSNLRVYMQTADRESLVILLSLWYASVKFLGINAVPEVVLVQLWESL